MTDSIHADVIFNLMERHRQEIEECDRVSEEFKEKYPFNNFRGMGADMTKRTLQIKLEALQDVLDEVQDIEKMLGTNEGESP